MLTSVCVSLRTTSSSQRIEPLAQTLLMQRGLLATLLELAADCFVVRRRDHRVQHLQDVRLHRMGALDVVAELGFEVGLGHVAPPVLSSSRLRFTYGGQKRRNA